MVLRNFRARPVGRFNPRAPMIVAMPFAGLQPGDKVPLASFNRLRRWWRSGWIVGEEHAASIDQSKAAQSEAPAEAAQPSDDVAAVKGEILATPVSAVEGNKGWWTVTYSDGSERKLRRDDVDALGLPEQVAEGEFA